MSARMPSVFLSHGSPMTAIQPSAARDFMLALAADLPRPRAILVLTAHFETDIPAFSTDPQPGMIYDFGGFPQPLYEIVWPAPGEPEVAIMAATLAQKAGFRCGIVKRRGFDHGTWVPLHLVYPDAEIPVVQMSVQPGQTAGHHIRLGQALSPLREEGVMIVGSGTVTHNLRALNLGGRIFDAPVQDWVAAFTDWIAEKVTAGDAGAIAQCRETAPFAVENHPTDEHFLPLPFAMGAGTDNGTITPGRRIHHSYEYGTQAMDAYVFG